MEDFNNHIPQKYLFFWDILKLTLFGHYPVKNIHITSERFPDPASWWNGRFIERGRLKTMLTLEVVYLRTCIGGPPSRGCPCSILVCSHKLADGARFWSSARVIRVSGHSTGHLLHAFPLFEHATWGRKAVLLSPAHVRFGILLGQRHFYCAAF